MRRRAKIDATQPAIVEALRAMGASVTSLAEQGNGCPDLLAGYRGRTLMFECKRNEKALLTDDQTKWINEWRGGPVWVVYTPQQAIDILRNIDNK